MRTWTGVMGSKPTGGMTDLHTIEEPLIVYLISCMVARINNSIHTVLLVFYNIVKKLPVYDANVVRKWCQMSCGIHHYS